MNQITESSTTEIDRLENRLFEFYNSFEAYPSFAEPAVYFDLWDQIMQEVVLYKARGEVCRVLEVGSGTSDFGRYLREKGLREWAHITSQDVTGLNRATLEANSDEVHIGSVADLDGQWDVIFHTYVFEHVCRPKEFTDQIWSLLRVGGKMIVQCPRYDVPGYFSPCLDHMSGWEKASLALKAAAQDLVSVVTGRPQFAIYDDPAVFHIPFVRDRDAIHRVCKRDLCLYYKHRAKIGQYSLRSRGLKDMVVKNVLTVRLVFEKLSDL